MGVMDAFGLDSKVALVTGGNRGIGRALAHALGQAGAAVAVTARSDRDAAQAAADLTAAGVRAYGTHLDVRDPDSVNAAVSRVCDVLGPVGVLVNNAGVSIGAAALQTTPETWRDVLATNLDGVWHCCRAVAPSMIDNGGGTIVNIGSMSGFVVNRPRWQAAYLASKAAVHQLTKALAAEWADHGIRVNAIAPGYILTDASPVDQPEYRQWCVEPAALKRWGTPDELGPAVVFLASPASSFMTGSIVVIDGGYTLY